jgi:hypothetical protein
VEQVSPIPGSHTASPHTLPLGQAVQSAAHVPQLSEAAQLPSPQIAGGQLVGVTAVLGVLPAGTNAMRSMARPFSRLCTRSSTLPDNVRGPPVARYQVQVLPATLFSVTQLPPLIEKNQESSEALPLVCTRKNRS